MRKVFKATSRAAQNGEDSYDAGKSRLHQVGRKHILALDSDDARIAVHELETGGSRKSATEFVNQHRRENGREAVGVSTIYNLMHRLGVVTTRVRRRPQGDFSPNGGVRTKLPAPLPRWVHPHAVAAAHAKVQLALQGAGGAGVAAAAVAVDVPAAVMVDEAQTLEELLMDEQSDEEIEERYVPQTEAENVRGDER